MLHILLALAAIYPFFALFFLIFMSKEGYDVPSLLLSVTMAISNVGYYMLSTSDNLQEAMLANRITYFGGVYLPLMITLSVAQLCRFRVPRQVKATAYFLCGLVTWLIFSRSDKGYFYKSVEFHNEDGFGYLTKVYGWGHTCFQLLLFANILFSFYIIIRTLIERRRDVPARNVWMLFEALTGSALVYVAERAAGLHFDVMPVVYCIDLIVIVTLAGKTEMYNVSGLVMQTYEEMERYGYLVLDSHFRYMGSNIFARRVFPYLEYCSVEHPIELQEELARKTDAYPLFEEILSPLRHFADGTLSEEDATDREVEVGFIHLGCSFHALKSNGLFKKTYGYFVEMVDDTSKAESMRMQMLGAKRMQEQIARAENFSREAQIANRAKSDFLAAMSHEIRTPINAVLGMNAMILRESGEENIREYARDIGESAQILLDTINDILDISKVESGRLELNPAEYRLKDLLHESVSLVEIRARDANLNFLVEADSGLPSVLYGDMIRIRQILVNLLINAVKYTHEGSVTLRVNASPETPEKPDVLFLRLQVEDTGIGIKEENLGRIFHTFQRVDEEQNGRVEGTGLGLAITQQLVHLMRGEITVSSEYGKGSVFTVMLPQRIVDARPMGAFSIGERRKEPVRAQAEQKILTTERGRILAVDDVDMNLKVLRVLLKNTQLELETALSGQEALDKIASEHYDLIFLDHMMPEMDGVEVLRRMQEMENCPNAQTPVITLTANAIRGAMEGYLKIGFTDYLAKPFKPEELESMIKKYL